MSWPVTFCIQMISARMACRWHRSPQHIGSRHHPNFETWSRLKRPFLNPLALLPTDPSCKNLHQVILQRLQMGRETSVQQIGQSHIEITFSKPRSRRPDSLHHVCPSPATHHHLVGNITVTPHLFFPYSAPQRLVRHPCPGTASKQIIVATLPVAVLAAWDLIGEMGTGLPPTLVDRECPIHISLLIISTMLLHRCGTTIRMGSDEDTL